MPFRVLRLFVLCAVAIAIGSGPLPRDLWAQVANNGVNNGVNNGANNNNNNNNQNNNNNNNNNGGGIGFARQPIAGVEIDGTGVLRMKVVQDPTGRLLRDVVMAARAKLAPELAKASERRYVSLNRLEASIRDRIAKNQTATDEMKYLAGLTRLEYVFYLADSKDIVIAGPAEGFALDPSGRPIGITTGRSILELQDMIVALRAFPPGRQDANVISVSIDPTQNGLARMQEFLGSLTGITPGDDQFIAGGLQNSLGLQKVTILGVSPQTHFAQVLVEADYRMKLIGIGLEIPPAPIASYVSRASPGSVSKNAMERWFFVPNYECVRVAADGTAMQLVGEGVKLIGANERVNADGKRIKSGGVNKASLAFCQQFTAQYPALAKRSPVYAQLRNLIDMAVGAAWIQQQNLCDQAGWKMELFRNEASLPVETLNTPKQVETAVNVVWKGNTLMTPIGGGVSIEPREAFSPGNLVPDEKNAVKAAKEKVKIQGLAAGQWWWD